MRSGDGGESAVGIAIGAAFGKVVIGIALGVALTGVQPAQAPDSGLGLF
jgi:hypothetical protein